MRPGQFFILLYITLLAFWAIYITQPLQPQLARVFAVGEAEASLLMTAVMLPLGIAPVFYGLWLQAFSAKRLLRWAVLALGLSELLAAFTQSFTWLLALRALQGAIIPGMLTALMTYIAGSAAKGQVQRMMAIYVGTTIFSGFVGRLLSGWLGGWGGWTLPFFILGLALLLGAALLSRLQADPQAAFTQIRWHEAGAVLQERLFWRTYLAIFCVFFVFASLLNFLPFRLRVLDPEISELRIALTYVGYLIGVLIAWNAMRLSQALGGVWATILLGHALLLLALPGFLLKHPDGLLGMMFVLCAGMFTVHSVAPGYLNHRAGQRRGVVNGLYISFYYTGGALGSWLPGYLYGAFGWTAYVLTLSGLVFAAMWLMASLRHQMT